MWGIYLRIRDSVTVKLVPNQSTDSIDLSLEEKRKRHITRVSFVLIALGTPYIPIFLALHLTEPALMVIPLVFLFASAIILNKCKKDILAGLLIITTTSLGVLYYGSVLGNESGTQFMFLAMTALPPAFFNKHQKIALGLGYFIPLICFYWLFFSNGALLHPLHLSTQINTILYFTISITSFLIIILSNLLFSSSAVGFEEKLLESNEELKNKNNRLSLNYLRVKQMITKIRAQQAMEADLEKGKKLQNSVLPQRAPKLENVVITHAFEPAKTLSGDYFDYFLNRVTALILPKPKKNEGDDDYDEDDSDNEENVIYKQIGIVVADVVGKGVAASLEMFSVKTVFKLLHDHWFEPQALVTRMNQISTDSHLFSKYVPLIYVALTQVEAHQYLLEYVNAGHEPAIVVRAAGTVEILDQGGAPVGMDPDEKYIQNAITLYPGDVVYIVTDGCTDVKSPTGEVIGHEELIPILIEASKKKDVDMAKYVRNRLRDFQGNAAQADDMTIVAIQIL